MSFSHLYQPPTNKNIFQDAPLVDGNLAREVLKLLDKCRDNFERNTPERKLYDEQVVPLLKATHEFLLITEAKLPEDFALKICQKISSSIEAAEAKLKLSNASAVDTSIIQDAINYCKRSIDCRLEQEAMINAAYKQVINRFDRTENK